MAASSACPLIQAEAAGAVPKEFVRASAQAERSEPVGRESTCRGTREQQARPERPAWAALAQREPEKAPDVTAAELPADAMDHHRSPMADAADAWAAAQESQAAREFLSEARLPRAQVPPLLPGAERRAAAPARPELLRPQAPALPEQPAQVRREHRRWSFVQRRRPHGGALRARRHRPASWSAFSFPIPRAREACR